MDWSLIIKTSLIIIVGAYLLSCRTKKKEIGNLQDWIDTHYPGTLKVIETQTEDPIRRLSFKVKNSTVASLEDSMLQINIHWDKRQPGLGIIKSEVDSMLANAKKELSDTRHLLELLQSKGVEYFSCGINLGDIRILVFEEPLKKNRDERLVQLLEVLAGWPEADQYGLGVYFMEPKAYGEEFNEIIPLVHWHWSAAWQRKNSIISLLFQPGYLSEPQKLKKMWEFNTESDRLLSWIDQSRPVAEKWAKMHLKRPFTMPPEHAEYEILSNALGVKIKFPFNYSTAAKESETYDGYIAGEYLLDEKEFSSVRISKE